MPSECIRFIKTVGVTTKSIGVSVSNVVTFRDVCDVWIVSVGGGGRTMIAIYDPI